MFDMNYNIDMIKHLIEKGIGPEVDISTWH
jgi:hypothetical protein